MANQDFPEISISDEKLCFIIEKAREFDVKDVVTDPDSGSNPADDAMIAVLEDHRDDPVVQELIAVIKSMSVDEQIDLVALTWLGRGDGGLEDWQELRAEAARAHNRRTAAYLLGIPLLADYLGEAASLFGMSAKARRRRLVWTGRLIQIKALKPQLKEIQARRYESVNDESCDATNMFI